MCRRKVLRRKWMSLFLRFIKNEDGQTSTEYILLLAVVALIVFRFKGAAIDRLGKLIDGVFNNADGLVQEMSELQ